MNYNIPEFATNIIDEGFGPEDASTRELYKEVAAFAKQGQPIMIFGPTGAGKEFLARHYYNTLIKAEFYQQNKENWPAKFNEIRRLYSKYYSGKSLDIFLNSIRAGVFQSINSATIYPHLAESILFGHEAGAFTGAETRPGLLESIKYGILFMDEIGELSKDLQAKLLRAVDSEIAEGCRVSGKMDYSLKDLIIISATNRPRKKIREDFYYKMGIEVEIKGIDERPKDVQKSIPHFISKAIGKRKDYAAIANMLGITINDIQSVSKLSDAKIVRDYANLLGETVTDEILIRKWPGNFRALRRAIESSVMRIESPGNPESFSEKFGRNLKYYVAKYSDDSVKTTLALDRSYADTIYPSSNPGMDIMILEELNDIKSLQNLSDYEKKALAIFLSSTHEKEFSRRDLGEFYKKHTSIKHLSEANIRIKINRLQALRILSKTGNGKITRYHLTRSFLDLVNIKIEDIFTLPKVNNKWIGRSEEIKDLASKLKTVGRVYIKAPPQYGKTAFIVLFCSALEEQYNFYYYPLGDEGLKKMFKDLIKLLRSKTTPISAQKSLEDPVTSFHPYLDRIFKPGKGTKPVLILDNVNFISDLYDFKTMADLAKKWTEVELILAGENMDSVLEEDFIELQLRPWGKEA